MPFEKDLASTIGENIRSRRVELAKTQQRLAEESEISRTYIARIERGEKIPNVAHIIRIAIALDVSADHLLGITEQVG